VGLLVCDVEAERLISTCPAKKLETGEAPVKYLILIYSNPSSREIWDRLPAEERAEGLAAYSALNEDLNESGEMIVAEALADPSLAKRVSVKEGRPMTTDGPFAEVKELVAGFYVVDCESIERAVEIAAKIPEAELGLVELRPCMDLSGFEM
jgi:hypothetical protein